MNTAKNAAARAGRAVTVLERGRRPLKKLGVTGNGRGNLLNAGAPDYPGGADFAAQVLGLPVRVDARLIEQDYGIFEGRSVTDEAFLRAKRQFAVRYPGGESMMQVAARVYALLDEERARGGGPVLLVCHGGVLRLIRTYFEDLDNDAFFHYSAKNAQVETYRA